MKKHGFRSIFSLLLALMMVCSMLPTAAFAEGDTEEQSVVVEPVGTPAGELKQDEVKQPEGETPEEPKQPEGETPEEPKQPEDGTSQGPAKPADAAQWDAVVPGKSVLTVPQIPEPDVNLTALNTGHKIDVTFTVLYVGDEFKIGYNYGSSEKTQFVCQYKTNHSDTAYNNHTIAISDIKAAADRASVNSGYQIVGWSKESSANPKTWGFNLREPTACNKGTTIYLVAKNPNPTTKYTYTLNYDANGGTGAPSADSWSTTDASIRYHSFTVTSTVPTLAGYTFKGWKAKDGSDTIYTGGMTCAVSQYGNDVVKNGNTWTRTLYAVWEKNAPNGPTLGEVTNLLGQVKVHCTTPIAGHEDQTYGLYYALSSMVMAPDGSGYTCDVRVEADDYVTKYNGNYPGTDHVLADGENGIRPFVLRNDNDGKGWYISEGRNLLPIVFNVKCEAPTPPSVPTDKEIAKALEGRVNVVVSCVTANSGHPSERYPLFAYVSGLTKPNPNEVTANSDGTYSYTVSFLASNFVKMYSGAAPFGIGSDHELADTQDLRTVTLTLRDSTVGWTATTQNIDVSAKCEEQQPEGPSEITDGDLEALLKGALKIECTVVEGHVKLYDVRKEDVRTTNVSGYNAEITFDAIPYFGEFIGEFGQHSSAAGESYTKVITLKWVDGKWVATNTPIIHKVVCVPEIVPPAAPNEETVMGALKGAVQITCITPNSGHDLKVYDLMSGFTPGTVQGDASTGYTYTISVNAASYVYRYSGAAPDGIGAAHELATDEQQNKQITLHWNGTAWVAPGDGLPINFNVKCETENPPVDIKKPTFDELKDLLEVKVECTNESAVHKSKFERYALKNVDEDSKFAIGEVDQSGDVPTCTVTIGSVPYVAAFDGTTGKAHDPADTTKTVDLVYNKETGKWALKNADDATVVFQVACTTEEPEVPGGITDADLAKLKVVIHCTTNGSHTDRTYDLIAGTYRLDYSDEGFTCYIAVLADQYVNKYIPDTGTNHELVDPQKSSKTITLRWNTETKAWAADSNSVTFDVECTTQEGPAAPTAEQVASLLKVKVSCANLSAAHQENMPAFVYQPLLPGSFDIGGVTDSAESGYACRITVRAARYVQDFNTRSNAMHAPTDGTEKAVTLYYEDGSWTVGTGSGLVEFTVICENVPAQKYTVTYTDGVDGVEIFKDQVYADLTAGTATPKFNGTPTRVGYFFAGWNPAVTATVTGNVTYTATWKVDSNNNGKPDDEEERYTVTYLDGANGRAFASQVYPGLLSGTATPKFNGTPVRSGYVFIGWSPVWSGTVTGNVTYTATWSTITGGLDKVPKTGDNGLTLALSALLLFSFCGAAACVVSTKKRG